jgi:UDP-N-acetylmuramate dehydrogenase
MKADLPPVHSGVALGPLTTFGVVAAAERFADIDSLAGLHALREAMQVDAESWILGGGSNFLFTQAVVPGLCLHIRLAGVRVVKEDAEMVIVEAAAGESWHGLVCQAVAAGWAGLENLALIPGSVGAAPVQNIGAYGVELCEVMESVHVMDLQSGEEKLLLPDECDFGYRHSLFKTPAGRGWLITAVRFRLRKSSQAASVRYAALAEELRSRGLAEGELPTTKGVFDAVVAIRRSKLPDPAQIGNAGSFFQNPSVPPDFAAALASLHPALPLYPQPNGRVKLAAGWLIEQAGWKGRRLGPAGVHDRQALVLVNHGGATGVDVLAVALAVQAAVQEMFGVALVPEVNIR